MELKEKYKIVESLVGLYVLLSCFGCTVSRHSFTPGALWSDNKGVHINAHGGGLLYRNGTYYWYGEHKTEGKAGNVANVGVHCYSSKDLYCWKDEGIALKVMPEGSLGDIEKGCVLERPKVIYNERTQKYVMWFHLELKGQGYTAARAGVAVSDTPQGPFFFIRSMRITPKVYPLNFTQEQKNKKWDFSQKKPNAKSIIDGYYLCRDFEDGQMSRDMNLFVDKDKKAYHIYASEENSTLHIAELSDDYLTHTGKYVRLFPGRYMEAPAMFERNGKYYLMMSDCTGWAPNAARSAVADSIMGEWKELGNPCLGEDANTTFHSQSTYILPVAGKSDTYIYMGDRWTPDNAIDGRYIWLPIDFENNRFTIKWQDKWSY